MMHLAFLHNDPDSYHDTKLTLHDCIADKITYSDSVLSFRFPDGFWVYSEHEANNLSKTVRTDASCVDFAVTPDEHFEIYLEVFRSRRNRKATVEYWQLKKVLDAVNSGKYQLEFIYQYRTHFEQMWRCMLRYKGCLFGECQLHIPYSSATYSWNKLREDCIW